MFELKSKYIGKLLFCCASLYLLIKIFLSLDFTDEMQYYGQIFSLVLNDKLFSADLFFSAVGLSSSFT